MDKKTAEARLEAAQDELAAVEHERWAHWQRYMHRAGERRPDGSLILPADLVTRWERQITTPFAELSETERDSDREQVRRYIPLVAEIVTR